jgi:L-galactose dehydrogenase
LASRKIVEICSRYGESVSSVSIRFCLDHPYVASTLVGMATVAEVQANLELLQAKSDPALLAEIRGVVASAFDMDWPSGKPENNG